MLIGDNGVGKSCTLLRFVDDTYTDVHINTIGVDFRFKTVRIEKKAIRLQIWDTAGQERFRTITSAYYRGADGIIILFDLTVPETFNHVNEWYNEVNRYAAEDTCKLLLGNKCDRKDREVPASKGQTLAEKLGMPYMEVSAKEKINIDEAFMRIATDLMKTNRGSRASTASVNEKNSLSNGDKRSKKGCC